MENKRPLILVSNDDGIMAKGISELIKFLRPLGEIVVMAPDAPRYRHYPHQAGLRHPGRRGDLGQAGHRQADQILRYRRKARRHRTVPSVENGVPNPWNGRRIDAH